MYKVVFEGIIFIFFRSTLTSWTNIYLSHIILILYFLFDNSIKNNIPLKFNLSITKGNILPIDDDDTLI